MCTNILGPEVLGLPSRDPQTYTTQQLNHTVTHKSFFATSFLTPSIAGCVTPLHVQGSEELCLY
jgi:hypothetical protein